jgi:hypothetical protein
MKITTAKKLLGELQGISSIGWRWQLVMRELAEKQKVTSYWYEDRYRNSPDKIYKRKGFPDIQTESTYDKCVTASLYEKNNKIVFETVLYDGDFLNGNPTQRRCVFQTEITTIFPVFEKLIYEKLEYWAIDIYEERLETQRQIAIQQIMVEILTKLDK